MSVVGEFPGLNALRRRAIRGPINPIDKSTVVSLYPNDIHHRNPTIQPGEFLVPGGNKDNPGILVVGPSSWWRDVDEDQPLLEIPVSSIQIAESIVKDYCNAVLGVNGSSTSMGVFYVPGCVQNEKGEVKLLETKEWVKKNFATELNKALELQKNWYIQLSKMADSLWARSNGNPLSIGDDMRFAAQQLGYIDKEWLKDHRATGMVRCNACGSLKNPDYPVCMSCRAVDMEHPKAKNLKFAQ